MLTKQKPKPPQTAIPESFKSIGAQMRKALTAKAAALCERDERGEIKLDPLDANALMRASGADRRTRTTSAAPWPSSRTNGTRACPARNPPRRSPSGPRPW